MPTISKKQMQEYEQFQNDRAKGRILTPDGIRLICAAFDNDPQKIGVHMLELLTKYNNEGLFDHRYITCIFFWQNDGENGYMSNWFHCPFSIDGIVYSNTEQYFMAKKAELFGDTESLERILKSESPKECKALGRQVAPFDGAVWDAQRYEIMKTGNREKFLQNPELLERLLSTGDAILAEASPVDGIWGIKLSADAAEDVDPARWPGMNLQGKLLMELRNEFRTTKVIE